MTGGPSTSRLSGAGFKPPPAADIKSEMPPALQCLVLTVAGWMNRRQEDLIDHLREENRTLREHMGPRPLPSASDSPYAARNSDDGF